MVGNDGAEDTAAAQKGMDVYLVTDCLMNPGGADLSSFDTGSFGEFMAFAGLV